MLTERRLIALCTSSQLRSWIEAEVSDLISERSYTADVGELLRRLGRGAASRADVMVLDLDVLSPPSSVGLKLGLEERWWNGTIIGIGTPRTMHRRYLRLDRVIDRPLGSETLRACIENNDGEDTAPVVDWPKRLLAK